MLSLSISSSRDLDELFAFYIAFPHSYYALRSRETSEECAAGNFVIARSSGQVVGAAGLFRIHDDWSELAQGRVVLNGRGIYKALIAARVLRSYSANSSPHKLFAEVDEPNQAVQNILLEFGFCRFDPPQELRDSVLSSLPSNKRPDKLGYDFVWLAATARSIELSRTFMISISNRNDWVLDKELTASL